jgi:hypothetical protein
MMRNFAILLAVLAASAPAFAQDQTEAEYLAALEAALPGTLMNNPLDAQWLTHGDGAKAKVTVASDIPGQRAYQVQVREVKPNPWDISAHGSVSGGVEAGDTVMVAFWARASKPDARIGAGGVQARLQQKAAPYAGVIEKTFTLAERWQVHYMSGVAGETFAPGGVDISFNIGHLKQTVEFGQYYVTNLGKGVDPALLPSGSEDPQ